MNDLLKIDYKEEGQNLNLLCSKIWPITLLSSTLWV